MAVGEDVKSESQKVNGEAPAPTRNEERKGAIADAIKAAEVSIEEEEKPPVEKKETPKPAAKTKEEEDSEKTEAEQGRELLKALKDPQRAGFIIDYLAKQAGYTKSEVKKADPEEIKDDVLEIIKGELGEEFGFLSPKLASAITKILDKKLAESEADIRADLQAKEQEKLNNQAAKAQVKLAKDFFDADELPDNVTKEMSKLMDKITPTADMSVSDYMEIVFHTAVGKLGLVKVDRTKNSKVARNRSDVAGRLASERTPTGEPARDTSKPLTRHEAIRLAIESAQKEEG